MGKTLISIALILPFLFGIGVFVDWDNSKYGNLSWWDSFTSWSHFSQMLVLGVIVFVVTVFILIIKLLNYREQPSLTPVRGSESKGKSINWGVTILRYWLIIGFGLWGIVTIFEVGTATKQITFLPAGLTANVFYLITASLVVPFVAAAIINSRKGNSIRDESGRKLVNMTSEQTVKDSSSPQAKGMESLEETKQRLAAMSTERDSVRSENQALQSQIEEQKSTMAAYEDIVESDKRNLTGRVLVTKYDIGRFNLSPTHGGWIEFKFTVFNGSILTAKVGYRIEGVLRLFGEPIVDQKLSVQTPQTIAHGTGETITVHQILSGQMCQVIIDVTKKPDGKTLIFDFSDVRISLESKTPYGKPGPDYCLEFRRFQKHRVYRSGPLEGSYLWEFLEATDAPETTALEGLNKFLQQNQQQ